MNVIDQLVANVIAAGDSPPTYAVGVVSAVDPAHAPDQVMPIITVRWQGADVRAIPLVHYTPAVGHVVFMARFGPQLVILGRLPGSNIGGAE